VAGCEQPTLKCRVVGPLSSVQPGIVIDRLTNPGASMLTAAGYPKNPGGEVEGTGSTQASASA